MADRVHPAMEDSPSAPPLLRESVSIQMVPEKLIRKEQEQALISSHGESPEARKERRKDIIYSTPQPLPADHPSNWSNGGGREGKIRRRRRKRKNPCCCCLLSFMATLLTIAVILGLTAGILWLVLKPKAPKFEVTDAKVSKLELKASPSSSSSSTASTGTAPWLDASVTFTVQAENPNQKIGIQYDSVEVSLSYDGQEIGRGAIPAFYQGHGNVTILSLDMEGSDISLAPAIASSLNSTLSAASNLPFHSRADARVRVRVGSWTSGASRVRVDCDVVVTSPSSVSNPSVSLVSKSCSFKLKSLKLF